MSQQRCSSVGAPCASVASSPPTAPRQRRARRCWARRSRRGSSAAPGCHRLELLSYLAEFAVVQLAGLRHLVVVDCKVPVSFFAYPSKPSSLVPDGCEVHVLAGDGDDPVGALEALADAVGAAPDAAPLASSVSPRSTERSPHRRSGRCRAGRGPARGRDRVGRGPDVRRLGDRRDGGAAPSRLAHAHRRIDRPGTAGRHRRGRGLPATGR